MQVYLVGGAVRDQLLGHPYHEKDYVVVGAMPEQLLAQGFQPVGKDFPVFLHPETKDEYALARTEMQRKSAFSPLFLHIPLCRIQMQKKRIFFFIFLYAWIPLFSSPDSFTPNS